jgi:hypothetical protein
VNREFAVSSWDTTPSEVAADGRPWRKRGMRRSPHCCKSLHSYAELVVGQSPAGKNMRMKAEDIVRIHHQETTGEDKAD